MATMIANPVRETSLFGRFGAAVSDFVAAVREGRAMAERYKYLSRLSNADLARLGIDRRDIPQAVVRG